MATANLSIGPTSGGEQREDMGAGNVLVCKVVNKIYTLRNKYGSSKQLEYTEK